MKQLWFIILPSDHRGWGELMDVEKRHTGRDRAFFYKKSGRLAFQISGEKVRGAVSHLGLPGQIQNRRGVRPCKRQKKKRMKRRN